MTKLSKPTLLIITLAAIAAAAALIWSRQQMSGGADDLLYIPPEVTLNADAELLREYIRIDTSNPPGNERPGAEFLARVLRDAGVEPEIIESAPGRANVYARITGKRSGEGLLLYNHIDVAPASPEGWTEPPFSAAVRHGMIYGRGALDMKGIAIAQLLAFVEVAKSGRQPERDLVFLATADEERSGRFGAEWLLKNRPEIFDGIAYAINEGGVTEMEKEKIDFFGIEVSSRQFVVIRLRAGSREPLRQLRLELEPYFTPLGPEHISPEVAAYMKAIEPHRSEWKEVLRDVEGSIEQGKFWLLHPQFKALTQNTMSMSGVEQEDDGGWSAMLTLHNLPSEQPDERVAFIRSFAVPLGVSLEVLEQMGPSHSTPVTTPFYEVLRESVQAIHGKIAVGPLVLAYGTNDSRFLRAHGIHAYGMFPFKVDLFQTQGIHGPDERIRVDWFYDGVALMKRIAQRWSYAG
jgi:acetylornithine deacetylase/succinyl-diaminopimelate desuccinylase-like protein